MLSSDSSGLLCSEVSAGVGGTGRRQPGDCTPQSTIDSSWASGADGAGDGSGRCTAWPGAAGSGLYHVDKSENEWGSLSCDMDAYPCETLRCGNCGSPRMGVQLRGLGVKVRGAYGGVYTDETERDALGCSVCGPSLPGVEEERGCRELGGVRAGSGGGGSEE